mgnify:CR=1
MISDKRESVSYLKYNSTVLSRIATIKLNPTNPFKTQISSFTMTDRLLY